MIYSVPAMSMENEFINLDYLAKYVDRLVVSTGDEDYRIVYEWTNRGPGSYPPVAVLVRSGDTWERRPVLATGEKGGKHSYTV